MQIDIGFGDAADQQTVELAYPTLLDQDSPSILAYRPEFVVAEKLEAVVALGDINTRLKDYYYLLRISRNMALPREGMIEALRATFMRRGTALPSTARMWHQDHRPHCLSPSLSRSGKIQQNFM